MNRKNIQEALLATMNDAAQCQRKPKNAQQCYVTQKKLKDMRTRAQK